MGVTVSKSLLAVAALAGGPLLLRHYLLNSAESSQGPGKNATRNKKRREKQKQRLQAAESQSQVVTAAPQRPAPRAKDERKAEQANEVPPSSQDEDADFPPLPSTSSVSLSSKGGPKRPLAERRAPKTRQGRVADMLDPDVDSPGSVARVMQINSQGQAVPQKEAPNGTSKATRLEAKKETSWVDVQVAAASTDDSLGFEDSEETPEAEEDAWEQVPSKSQPSKAKTLSISNLGGNSKTDSVIPGLPNKKARQNAAKRAADKATREAKEADRLARLQAHRTERARDASHQASKAKMTQGIKSVPAQSGSSKATVSGGMRYGMSETGNLIWE